MTSHRCALAAHLRPLTICLALLLAGFSSPATIRDGGIDPANLGKGDWIYILPNAINHMGGPVSSVTDLNSMMIFLKNQGLRYIIIKAADGNTLYPSAGAPQFTASVVNAGHAAGLWVFGYNRSYGLDLPGESAMSDYVFNAGADGFVFDAEIEWESQNLANNTTLATQLCSMVRSNWPNKFLAHSPFPIITSHSSFPYKEFGYYCDAVMPQDYWIEIGVTPTSMVNTMTTQWKNWQNGLSGKWVNSIKPIAAAGQGWSSASGTIDAPQITEFFTALKTQAAPATTGGYKGINFWRAELHPLEVWDAIRTNNLVASSNAPVVSNVSASGVTSSSAIVNWTSDLNADSIVDYSLDTSYTNAVTNTSPIYYHTISITGLNPSTTYHFRARSRNALNPAQQGVSGDYVFTTSAVTVGDVVIESYQSSGVVTPNPPYSDAGFVGTPSTCKSSAAGLVGSGVRYSTGGSGTPSVTLKPSLMIPGGSYAVYLTHCASSVSPDIVATISQSGCSGLPASTTAYQAAFANQWVSIGVITLNPGVTVPTLTFTKSSGTLGGSSRMYSDAYKFVYVPPPPSGPSIATQPQSQTIDQGNSATFSVVASGTPLLFYQWRFNGSNIGGATASSFTRNNVQSTNAGSYSVLITNGVSAVTSSPAVLSVIVPPTILGEPSDVNTGIGLNATFTVTATGTPMLQYQWLFNGSNISGATASSVTITNIQPVNIGSYAVIVSSTYGTNLSDTATLNILDPFIAAHPQNQTTSTGGSVTFYVSAVGTQPMSYQWLKDGVILTDSDNISGSATASLSVSNVHGSDIGNYSVVVTNVNGLVVSSNATIIGPFPPSILNQPSAISAPAAALVSFSVNVAGQGQLGYRWRRQGTNISDGGKFSGALSPALSISNVQSAEMWNYSVLITNAYGSVTSSPAPLALRPLVVWGQDGFTQIDVPSSLTNVTGLAAGLYHSLVINADGSVSAWGAGLLNSGLNPHYGQSLVPAGLSDVTRLAAGFYHSVALRADGSVAAWGAGTNNTGINPSFGQSLVPAGLSNVTSIAAGAYHSLALRSDGSVVAWGAGSSNSGVSPHFGQAIVPAGLSSVVAVAAGVYHSLALKADGSVIAWGAGLANLGSSPNFGQSFVPSAATNVVAIACGGYHSLALKLDGSVIAWGAGETNADASPDFGQALVPAEVTNAVAVSGGFYHSLALRSDGSAVAWGWNSSGQASIPATLINGASIASGGYHNLVLVGDGAPRITLPPASHRVRAGSSVFWTTMAVGTQPMSYQWRYNSSAIPGATSQTLSQDTVQPGDSGSYSVVVSNLAGVSISPDALLTVTQLMQPIISAIAALEGGQIQLSLTGGPGHYSIDRSSNLVSWFELTNLTTPTGFLQYVDPDTVSGPRFYRARSTP